MTCEEEEKLRRLNRRHMAGCRGCRYLMKLEHVWLTCDYIMTTGKSRPCPVEGCTVKEEGFHGDKYRGVTLVPRPGERRNAVK